jgi:hypothetical protein
LVLRESAIQLPLHIYPSEIIVVAAAAQVRARARACGSSGSSRLVGVVQRDHEGGEAVPAALVLFPVGVYTPNVTAPESLHVVLAAAETRL